MTTKSKSKTKSKGNAKPKTLADLKPAPYNPHVISERAFSGLSYSMAEFGDLSGLVWNQRTGHLVAGHSRVRSLSEQYGDLSIKRGRVVTPEGNSFPVRVVDWNELKEKAANIAANSAAISGVFTDDLADLMAEVELDDSELFEALRFDDLGDLLENMAAGDAALEELAGAVDLLSGPGVKGIEPVARDDGGGPAVDNVGPPDSVRGEVYELGPHRLMCGDSTDVEDVARLMGGERACVAVIDPPFEMAEKKWAPLISDPCIVFGQAKHLRAIPAEIWRFERVIDKVQAHRSATVQIGHRHAFVAQCGTDRRLPRVSDTFPSVITVDSSERPEHQHEKPIWLLVQHLTHWTPEWAVLVDWFGGSGSGLIAAAIMGRRALVMELEPKWCDVIRKRWTAWARKHDQDPGVDTLD